MWDVCVEDGWFKQPHLAWLRLIRPWSWVRLLEPAVIHTHPTASMCVPKTCTVNRRICTNWLNKCLPTNHSTLSDDSGLDKQA